MTTHDNGTVSLAGLILEDRCHPFFPVLEQHSLVGPGTKSNFHGGLVFKTIIQLSLVNLNLSLFPLCFPYEPLLSLVLPSGLLSPYTSSISCPVCKHMTRISCQGYGDGTFLERKLSVASTQFHCIPHPVLKTVYISCYSVLVYMHVHTHICSLSYFPSLQIHLL